MSSRTPTEDENSTAHTPHDVMLSASEARRICSVTDVPVIVDADTGYGNAINVIRTVDELIRIGAGGMFLEDQVWPKRCGHMKRQTSHSARRTT